MQNKYEIRQTNKNDYPMLCEWWRFWRWTPIPLEVLPNNGESGVMISYEGINVCVGFIYATSSPVLFHFEFIVSNPEVKDRVIRREAIEQLIESVSDFVKRAGGKLIYTSLKNQNLISHYKKCGFEVGSTGCFEMVKSLY